MPKYKVGDKVKLRQDLTVGSRYETVTFVSEMVHRMGEILTIVSYYDNKYTIEENSFSYSGKMFEDTIVLQSSGKLQSFIEQNKITEDDAITMLEWHLK